MTDSTIGQSEPSRYRLSWRWKDTGLVGSSAWLYDLSTLQAWYDSLSRRYADVMEHWIEVEGEAVAVVPT